MADNVIEKTYKVELIVKVSMGKVADSPYMFTWDDEHKAFFEHVQRLFASDSEALKLLFNDFVLFAVTTHFQEQDSRELDEDYRKVLLESLEKLLTSNNVDFAHLLAQDDRLLDFAKDTLEDVTHSSVESTRITEI